MLKLLSIIKQEEELSRQAHTAPTKQRGLISLEGVPCGQDRTEHCALPESSQNFTQS